MTISVTSWFVDTAASENPPVKRTFTIAGSDYSAWVLGWPSISSRWDELKPNNVTINLANEDQTFNFFKNAKINIQASCALNLGFTHPTSGDELINLFTGTVGEVSFKDASVTLRLVDKIQLLSDRVVGTTNSAAVFSTATTLPSDVAWTLCTCYGGWSNIASISNPDIDYVSFQAWAAIFSGDSVFCQAAFKGNKVTEALRKVTQNTHSAAYMANNKLVFARWTIVNSYAVVLDNDRIKTLGVKIRADALINKQFVEFDYRVNSNSWASAVFAINSASVQSYGARESVLKDESFWYVSSANALNAAERALFNYAYPYDEVSLSTPLTPLHQTVGDTITAVDSHIGLNNGWRIMARSVNMDDASMTLEIDGSQTSTPFFLDISYLDRNDVLT